MFTTFKEFIARQVLPNYFRENDSFKDDGSKGFLERYLEIFGVELDENTYLKLEKLLDLNNPLLIEAINIEYINYHAFKQGDIDVRNIIDDFETYKHFITYINSIYKIKGTQKSFEAILGTIGITSVSLDKYATVASIYDNGVTYDQNGVNYDEGNCIKCFKYDINLEGERVFTSDLFNKINALIKLVAPLNTQLVIMNYNQIEVFEAPIEINIDENGNLVYDNSNDPGLILELDDNGDLIISGPNANKYFLNDEGDLFYINN